MAAKQKKQQSADNDYIYRVEDLSKIYRTSDSDGVSEISDEAPAENKVLSDVNLSLYPHEFVVFQGPSGVGKSTLLNLLGFLDTPTEGAVWFEDNASHELDKQEKNALRRRAIGFIFQFHHLFPDLDAAENIMVPLLLQGEKQKQARKTAEEIMKKLGIFQQRHSRPTQLSGGEKQRVAIARAIVHGPRVVIGDEITGNLDEDTSEVVLDCLLEFLGKKYDALIIATHDELIASRADRKFLLEKGGISEE